jgi:hypothetical protein
MWFYSNLKIKAYLQKTFQWHSSATNNLKMQEQIDALKAWDKIPEM